MYILEYNFFKKDDKYIFKAEIRFLCRTFLFIKICIYRYLRNKSDDYLIFIFVNQKSRKLAFKTGISVYPFIFM